MPYQIKTTTNIRRRRRRRVPFLPRPSRPPFRAPSVRPSVLPTAPFGLYAWKNDIMHVVLYAAVRVKAKRRVRYFGSGVLI